jgi:hypothetical protein
MTRRASGEAARRGPERRATSIYLRAMDASDADIFDAALGAEGLDDEVALLRLRIRKLLEESPVDEALLQGGLRLLLQAVGTRHRLNGNQADDLSDAVANLLEELRRVMYPDGVA